MSKKIPLGAVSVVKTCTYLVFAIIRLMSRLVQSTGATLKPCKQKCNLWDSNIVDISGALSILRIQHVYTQTLYEGSARDIWFLEILTS